MKIVQTVLLCILACHLISCGGTPIDNTKPPAVKTDSDHDGLTDDTDTDDDNDGTPDTADKFPLNSKEQKDFDSDGVGDNADLDDDNDGTADSTDKFPNDAKENADTDGDGTGNNGDTDDDNDGTADAADKFPLDNKEQKDTDSDGLGDNSDPDADNDGTANAADKFPLDAKEQKDFDGDGIGDNADSDDDNDGTADNADKFPLDKNEQKDTDSDGTGDNSDPDADNDGAPNTADKFPLDAKEQLDFDGDGIGDNTDTDDDNDGISDTEDVLRALTVTSQITIPTSAKVVIDKTRNLLFVPFIDEKQISVINLADGKVVKKIEVNGRPETLNLSVDNKTLYAALLVSGHQYYDFTEGTGKIAAIDLDQLTVSTTFDINLDPFDMVVTDKNKLIIASGSGQWTRIAAYDGASGAALGASVIRHLSNIAIDPTYRWVFSADTDISPQDVNKYDVSIDGITAHSELPYHGDYPIGGKVWVEPTGKLLIASAGTVFLTSDMTYVKTLDIGDSAIKQIEFDAQSNVAVLVMNNNSLKIVNLAELEVIKTIPATDTIIKLGFQNGLLQVIRQTPGAKSVISLEEPPCPECKSNRAPIAQFDLTPNKADNTQTVAFDATASSDPDGQPLTYRWDFEGDGIWDTAFSSSPKATFKYLMAKTYTPKLQVQDSVKATATANKSIAIVNGKNFGTTVLGSSANILAFPFESGIFDGTSTVYFADKTNKRIYLVDIKSGLTKKYFDTILPPAQILLSLDKTKIHVLQRDEYLFTNNGSYISTYDIAEQAQINTTPFAGLIAQITELTNNKFINIGSFNPTSILDLSTGTTTPTYINYGAIAVNQAGNRIYSLNSTLSRYTFDGQKLIPQGEAQLPHYVQPGIAAWTSPDENIFITAGGSAINRTTNEHIKLIDSEIRKVVFEPERNLIYTLNSLGMVNVFNSHSLQPISRINAGKPIKDLIVSQGRFYLVVSNSATLAAIIEYPHPCISCDSNLAPTAVLTVNPSTPKTGQTIQLDASKSLDEIIASLLFRWDLNGDGIWDTPFAKPNVYETTFTLPGIKFVSVQAKDQNGEVSTATTAFNTTASAITASIDETGLSKLTPDLVVSIPGKGTMAVADKTNKKIYFIDLALGKTSHSLSLEIAPEKLSVSADGSTLYALLGPIDPFNTSAKQYVARINIDTKTLDSIFEVTGVVTDVIGISSTRLITSSNFGISLIDAATGALIQIQSSAGTAIISLDVQYLFSGNRFKYKITENALTLVKENFNPQTVGQPILITASNQKYLTAAQEIASFETFTLQGYLTPNRENILSIVTEPAHNFGAALQSDGSVIIFNLETLEVIKTLTGWGQTKSIALKDGVIFGLTMAGNYWQITSAANPCPECQNNQAPKAFINPPTEIDTAKQVTFSALGSSDPEGAALSYRWDFNGDGIWDSNFAPTSEISTRYLLPGKFALSLQVRDSAGAINTLSIPIEVKQGIDFGQPVNNTTNNLTFLPKDFSVDTTKGYIYLLDDVRNRIYVNNIATGLPEKYFELDFKPEAITSSADGKYMYAALLGSGHFYYTTLPTFGYIAVIDTAQQALIKTFKIDIDPADITALDQGLVAVSSGSNQHTTINVFNIEEGKSVAQAYTYMSARLAADTNSNYLFSADVGLSPGEIHKYQHENATLVSLGDSPYHGEHNLGGNLWLTPDGTHVISASGDTLTTSSLTYANNILGAELFQTISNITFTENLGHALVGNQIVDFSTATLTKVSQRECHDCQNIFSFNNKLYAIKSDFTGIKIEGVPEYVANLAPVAKLTSDANNPTTRTSIVFSAAQSSDPEQLPLLYRWDLQNDGVWDSDFSTTALTQRKTFNAPGTYTVKLQIKDSLGLVSDAALTIMVSESPEPTLPNQLPFVPSFALVEPQSGALYSLDQEAQRIYITNLSAGTSEHIQLEFTPRSIALAPGGQFIYVAQSGITNQDGSVIPTQPGYISRLDAQSHNIINTFQTPINPSRILALSNNRVLIANGVSNRLMLYNAETGQYLNTARSFRRDITYSQLLASHTGENFYEIFINSFAGILSIFSAAPFTPNPELVDFDWAPLGTDFWFSADDKRLISNAGEVYEMQSYTLIKQISLAPGEFISAMANTFDGSSHLLLPGRVSSLAADSLVESASYPCALCTGLFAWDNALYAIKTIEDGSEIVKLR